MKTLNFFLLLFVCSIFFTSCGDDDASSAEITGIWFIVHEEGYEKYGNNKYEHEFSYPDNYDLEDSDVGGYVKFDKNGSYSFSLSEAGSYMYVGKWEYKDDKLILSVLDTDDGEYITTEGNVLKLTSTELIIETHKIDNKYEFYAKTTMQKIK